MRILVQDSASRTYFDGVNWADDAEQAKTFDSVSLAEAFCHDQNLWDALIVVRFNNGEQEDVTYPVGPRHALMVSQPPTTRIKRIC
jgi:hypothetical protein